MATAERYKKYETVGKPYTDCGREYIKVKIPCCNNPNCGKCYGEGSYLKVVRWYYGGIEFNGRNGFGFYEKGYITIFSGPQDVQDDFFEGKYYGFAWRNTIFGWFLPSTKEVPSDLPSSLTPIRVWWTEITNEKEELYNYDSIRQYINNIKCGIQEEIKPVSSLYTVGNRIKEELTVLQTNEFVDSSGYKKKKILLIDQNGTKMSWSTASKTVKYQIGEEFYASFEISGFEQIDDEAYIIIKSCRRVKK